MRKYLMALVLPFVFGCSNSPETYLEYINGYWEIEKVTLADGTNKSYSYNDTIDFISVNDSLIGFRKKLKPNLLGDFQTSNSSEHLKIVIENDSLNVYYETPFATWKETILNATAEQLTIINANKDVYLYKRYQSLDLN